MAGPQINALELDVVGWDGQLPMLDLVFLVKKLATDFVFISPTEVGCRCVQCSVAWLTEC